MTSAATKIEWTDATWNPVTGCTKVSEGCRHCYAERLAPRVFAGQTVTETVNGLRSTATERPRRFTDVMVHPDRLGAPLRWRKPRRVFVASMADPFHDAVPTEFLDRMFAVMALSPRHSYQLLTKRPLRMRAYITDHDTPRRVQRAMDAVAVDAASGEPEEWKSVTSLPYEVSSHGRVRRGGQLLKLVEHSGGYRQVALCVNAVPRTELVHRLVLTAFKRPPLDGEEACHLNGDRSDNRIANLRWGSKGANMADAARHGTAGAWMKSRARLTSEQVAEIRSRRAAGEKLVDVATRFGINKRQVSAIARGNIYKLPALEWPLACLWLGVSVENQAAADERIPLLLQTPAAVRFLSCEPLLSAIDLRPWLHDSNCLLPTGGPCICCEPREICIDWVIIGGESGPGVRPCDVGWVRSIVEQCKAAGVACFVKQLGARPVARDRRITMHLRDRKGGDPSEWPEDLRVREFPR